MCFMIYIENPVLCDVGVDLRGRQVAVSQEFLDAAQVRASIEQMGGEAVAERVWTGTVDQPGP